MKNLEVESHSVWVTVKTMHKARLETILHRADERKGEGYCSNQFYSTYADRLWESLSHACKRFETAGVRETQEYGVLSFDLAADSEEELSLALAACDEAVGHWVNKFRINYMKE